MKKGETNNNVPESNTLRSFNTNSLTLAIPTLRVSILVVFKVKSNNSKNFDQFGLILIESINLNM